MKTNMKHLTIFTVACALSYLIGCKSEPAKNISNVIHIDNIVDLTHTLTPEFPFIPVKKLTYPFELIPMASLEENAVEANSWKIHEHLGTHTDAPNHFIAGQKSLDQLDLKDLIVPVVVIDIEAKAVKNSDAELTIEDITNFEKEFGKIGEHSCVMMYSGWEKHLKDSMFVGLDSKEVKHYPGFSNAAIKFLIDERKIAGIGVDVLSFDPGVDEHYTGHKTLFSAGKWGVECVANLNKIPKAGATVIVAAPKVGKATGGFSRIIAVW
ncbi:MAG: cyclase family protein [Chitinophagaceae bacterium]|nr:MAG: cyclase family protein [Chitinophagaceae bacterium]